MSLIFGLVLPRKVYLVSDSRVTSSDGTYKDDFSKWLDLNPRLSVVVANSAHQASWLLRKIIKDIRPKTGWDWDFTDLESYLKKVLEKYALEYYAETGYLDHSVSMVFGGFEKKQKLIIDAGRMGDAMAAPVMAAGDGVMVDQTIDRVITDAFSDVLHTAAKRGEQVQNGTKFEVDLPRPRAIAVTIRATNSGAEVVYEDADCYGGIVFNPGFRIERVELPPDLIGQLEHRDKSAENGEDSIYEDFGILTTYVDRLLAEKGWPTVGGNVIPILITENEQGIATGMYIRRSNGRKGGITEVEGKPHYYDEDGNKHPYRFVYEYLDDGKMDALAKI